MAGRRRKPKADPRRVVGYLRVSTDEQCLGPAAQLAAIQDWCERKDAELVAVHEDIGVSGGTVVERHVGLNLAFQALSDHGAGVLLVAKRDRLARDVVVGAVAERMAERVGARVLSADGTGNGDGPEHQLMCHLIDCFACYERALIASRTKAALRVKKAAGQRVGAVPLGYRLADGDENLEPDPEEQEVIAIVQKLREAGLSLRAISRELQRRGHRSRSGGAWHVQSLANLLRSGPLSIQTPDVGTADPNARA